MLLVMTIQVKQLNSTVKKLKFFFELKIYTEASSISNNRGGRMLK